MKTRFNKGGKEKRERGREISKKGYLRENLREKWRNNPGRKGEDLCRFRSPSPPSARNQVFCSSGSGSDPWRSISSCSCFLIRHDKGVKMRVVYNLPNAQKIKEEEDEFPAVLALSPTASSAGPSTVTIAAVTDTKRPSPLRADSTKKNEGKSASSKSNNRRGSGSTNKASKSINRRSEAIMNWLVGVGCASEFKIRATVGDSPYTSKALRLLVKRKEVKRTGAGGRIDPFMYMVASKKGDDAVTEVPIKQNS